MVSECGSWESVNGFSRSNSMVLVSPVNFFRTGVEDGACKTLLTKVRQVIKKS
jgi:hypothetical protein